jgi:sugar phosphate isomerase/epimerase
MTRRHFLATSALALGSLPAAARESASGRLPAVFTKTMERVSADDLGRRLAAMGVTAIEAPIRRGGHIEPAQAPDKLPAFAEALKEHGVEIAILTSDIGSADDAAERLLKTAADLGIRRYRLAHYRYDLAKPIPPQLADIRAKLADLAAMNRQLGVQGQYQNHRGADFAGAPVWDMLEALEGIDVAQLGLAFDFAHATVEGTTTWELNLRRAAPQVAAVYFKDYRLEGRTWNACPLGKGIVHPQAGALVKQLLPATTPISLHVEYIGGSGEERVKRTLEAMAADLKTLQGWLA